MKINWDKVDDAFKVLAKLVLALFVLGCFVVCFKNGFTPYERIVNGHKYDVFPGWYGDAVCHSEECFCKAGKR